MMGGHRRAVRRTAACVTALAFLTFGGFGFHRVHVVTPHVVSVNGQPVVGR
jgi:hypothetical protein